MIQFDGQPWAPTVYTRPLRGRLELSDGPRLCHLLERHYRTPDGKRLRLDDWQKALFNHLLERFPLDWHTPRLRGRLRYRQAVNSLGRQNGKSLIGSGLSIYGLVQHVPAPSVVGIATSVDQANVVYERTRYAVANDADLLRRLKPSGTRGVRWRDGRGGYQVKPALAEGIQSVPVTLGLADELHLMAPAMWDSLVNGQRAQRDALLVGITTAGDQLSALLIRLYQQGHAAAAADPADGGRFGFFLWEAPEGTTIEDDAFITAANPAVACGRIDLETVRQDARGLPELDRLRYVGNRFAGSSASHWATGTAWKDTTAGDGLHAGQPITFGIDRTAGWEYVTITAATKHGDRIAAEVVATLRGIDRDKAAGILALLLAAHPRAAVAMDARRLSDLGKRLRDAGAEVWLLTQTEQAQALAGIWARVLRGTLRHAPDPITAGQITDSTRKQARDGSYTLAGDQIDAISALLAAAHVADTRPEPRTSQLYA